MKQTGILLMAVILFVSLLTNIVIADSNSFTIPWWTVDGGGGMRSAGGSFTVSGTAGQPDASMNSHRGGSYALRGGFWQRRETQSYRVYLPIIRWPG